MTKVPESQRSRNSGIFCRRPVNAFAVVIFYVFIFLRWGQQGIVGHAELQEGHDSVAD